MKRKSLLIVTLFLVAACIGYFSYIKWPVTKPSRIENIMHLKLERSSADSITLAQVAAKKIILFFGFVHCPDMCPITLQCMFEAMKTLPSSDVQGVFISFDTNRDTSEILKHFIEKYENRILAFSPAFDELQIMADTLGVVAKTRPQANGYTYDHSGLIYIISHDGYLLKTLPAESSASAIKDAL